MNELVNEKGDEILKSVFGKAAAVMLAAVLCTAMIPTSTLAADTSEGVTQLMNDKPTISNSTSQLDNTQSSSSSAATGSTANITKTKAEELARKYVNIPKEYTLQGANLSNDHLTNGTRNIWGLSFIKLVNGKHMGGIHVSIHADTGQLMSYNSYTNSVSSKPTYPLKVEREQAQQIASSFIKEVAGQYVKQTQFNESYGVQLLPALTGEVRHSFRFDRVVNDIPFLDNFIDVIVDSEGFVVDYQFVWDETIEFPKVNSYLTAEQAIEKLREASEPQLKYILTTGEQGKRTPLLSYELVPFAIDAVTGIKSIEQLNSYYRFSGEVSDKPLTDKPLAAPPKSVNVTEKQAIDIVKTAFGLPAGAELKNSSYNEHQDITTDQLRTSWDLYWTVMKDGKEAGSLWAVVNGQTGMIQHYNSHWNESEGSGDKELITLENATTKAIEAVKKQLPWLTSELYLVKPDPKQYDSIGTASSPSYFLAFQRNVHGANVEYDNVNVTIDARTGQVRGFEANIQPFTYPTTAPATITKEKAVDQWMNYYAAELTYRVVNEFTWNGEPIPYEKYNALVASGAANSGNAVVKSSKAELVYRLASKPIDQRVFLDAATGEWRSYETGAVTTLERPKVLDAEGHWAQQQLELMVAYKALDVIDGKVRPNEVIKRGELIQMLVIARNSGNYGYADNSAALKSASFNDVSVGSKYFSYVENALQQNLIDLGDGSFNPEGNVTREEMAELIVRALGYNSLAKHEHIFAVNFKDDAQIKNKGQAAIVVGLNIMSKTQEGQFQPSKQVTRAEAATAFFRYLQSRAELQEAPIRM